MVLFDAAEEIIAKKRLQIIKQNLFTQHLFAVCFFQNLVSKRVHVETVAKLLGISISSSYELIHEKGFPSCESEIV